VGHSFIGFEYARLKEQKETGQDIVLHRQAFGSTLVLQKKNRFVKAKQRCSEEERRTASSEVYICSSLAHGGHARVCTFFGT